MGGVQWHSEKRYVRALEYYSGYISALEILSASIRQHVPPSVLHPSPLTIQRKAKENKTQKTKRASTTEPQFRQKENNRHAPDAYLMHFPPKTRRPVGTQNARSECSPIQSSQNRSSFAQEPTHGIRTQSESTPAVDGASCRLPLLKDHYFSPGSP
jgi:hypothetical protein